MLFYTAVKRSLVKQLIGKRLVVPRPPVRFSTQITSADFERGVLDHVSTIVKRVAEWKDVWNVIKFLEDVYRIRLQQRTHDMQVIGNKWANEHSGTVALSPNELDTTGKENVWEIDSDTNVLSDYETRIGWCLRIILCLLRQSIVLWLIL